MQPRRYGQSGEKDGDSMTFFGDGELCHAARRGFQTVLGTARKSGGLLLGPVVEIDNKVPCVYYL
ncbi:hypothetical protein ACFLXT_00220 [Chloroflexota bacterium]